MASPKIDIKELLAAGSHFGHKSSRWHPKMSQYIHSKRDGTHIIDLTKTVEALDLALDFTTKTAAAGKQILLVSTKRQARDIIKSTADATGMPYVIKRWLGGMLTNQATIGARIRHLKNLESRLASGELAAKYSKLEVQHYNEEIEEMNQLYGGIKDMEAKPGAVFVVDIGTDDIAVREAKKLKVPVIALVDTNTDPSLVDYPIPANDDSTKTIELIVGYMQAAILEGKAKVKSAPAPAPKAGAPAKKTTAQEPAEEQAVAAEGTG